MSKKPLLPESQIRRFMTLASVPALAAGYIGRGHAAGIIREQDLEDEMLGGPPGMEDEDAPPVGDVGLEDVEGIGDEGPGDLDEATVEELVSAIARAIGEVTGVEVSVEGSGGPEEDLAGELPGEEEMGGELPGEEMAGGLPGEDEPMMELRNFVRGQLSRLLTENVAMPQAYKRDYEDDEEQGYPHDLRELLMQALGIVEGTHMPSGSNEGELINQGPNSNRDFEGDDNRQSSAGAHHTGGGKAAASRTHMGGNAAGLPLEEGVTDDLIERVTQRVAAKLLNRRS